MVRKSANSRFIKASRTFVAEANTNTVSTHTHTYIKLHIFTVGYTQEHITLTETNRETWFSKSRTVSHVYPNIALTDLLAINKALKLKAGDDMWLAYRPRRPTVCYGICGLRTSISNYYLTRVGPLL